MNKRTTKKKQAWDVRKLILTGIVVLIIILITSLAMKGCSVNHKSPRSIVEDLLKSEYKGKESRAISCYIKDEQNKSEVKNIVKERIKYFKAKNGQKLQIDRCQSIWQNKDYAYMLILYSVELQNKTIYPGFDTFMVANKNGKYYIMPPGNLDKKLKEQVVKSYQDLTQKEEYIKFLEKYKEFIRKNPNYEEEISAKMKKVKDVK